MFKLDLEIFQDFSSLAGMLGLEQVSECIFENKFLYLKKPLFLRISKESESQCKLAGKTELSNQKKLEQLLKEMKQCLEKRSVKPMKMTRNSQEKTFF